MEAIKKAALTMKFKAWEKKYRLQLTGYDSHRFYIEIVNAKVKTKKTKKK